MQRESWNNTRRSWEASGFPLTIAILVAQIVNIFLSFVHVPTYDWLNFAGPEDLREPWRILTYPFLIPADFFGVLFAAGLIYWFCGSLERSWGTRTFAIYFFGLTVLGAAAMSLAGTLLHTPVGCHYMLVVAAAGVAWGVLNADEGVSIWFIPMRGIHVAMLCVAYLVFTYARVPVLLPFALLPCAASYLWVRNRAWGGFGYNRPAVRTPRLRLVPSNPARTNRPKDDRFTFRDLNPFEWFARRRRQKQFERLMRDD